MRVPKQFHRKYDGLSSYDLWWLAKEMSLRLGQGPKTVSMLARELHLWKSQVVKIGLTYPRTFEVYAENGTHKVRVRL